MTSTLCINAVASGACQLMSAAAALPELGYIAVVSFNRAGRCLLGRSCSTICWQFLELPAVLDC